MQNKKFAVFGIASAAAMILSACGGNATPIVQTVVVEKVSTQVVKKFRHRLSKRQPPQPPPPAQSGQRLTQF